jgi:ubiquinol-cytochrome c reductase cytochrome b/c1 subunit
MLAAAPVLAQEEETIPRQSWSFAGMFGRFDRAQLQRGYQVYKEVCSNCHSLRLLHYRNLAEPGGPGFTDAQVKTLIKDVTFDDAFDDNGNPKKRPATLADAFKPPFPNDVAAGAAYGGAAPPDLSLMARAREATWDVPFYMVPYKWLVEVFSGYQEGGPDYIHALLTSFSDKVPAYAMDANGKLTPIPDAQVTKDSSRCASITPGEGVDDKGKPNHDECNALSEGLYYDVAFPGHQIHMPPPLSDGQVAYGDGTKATVDQYARDVAAFLMWASDPKFEDRKDVGIRMLVYLVLLSVFVWLAKRQIWSRLH